MGSIKVQVRFLAKENSWMEIQEGSTFRELAELARLKEKGTLVVLLNGRYAEPEKELNNGDVVTVFPPVAGG